MDYILLFLDPGPTLMLLLPQHPLLRLLGSRSSWPILPDVHTPAQSAKKPHQAMQHIIIWRPNVVSVIDGDILTMSAIFGSVEDVTPQDMWLITAQSIHLPNQMLTALMAGLTQTMMTSMPSWMTTREVRRIKPGARVYKGGNVTISFLSHVFFLVSIVY